MLIRSSDLRCGIVGMACLALPMLTGCGRPAGGAPRIAQDTFPDFTYEQVLDHFRHYHERSESTYRGNGTWENTEYRIAHPLVRDSSRRAQGYMRAFAATKNPLYRERGRAALDWLITDQKPDGHFTWWNAPAGTDNRVDCQYTTAEGGSALAEGYAFFGDPRYRAASARAAEWEESCELVWNTNYVLFAAWHLAKHYRITGEQRWLDAAVLRVARCAIPRQAPDGSWREGEGAPAALIGHNQRIWYHAIILRGAIEVYRVLPAEHAVREPLLHCIQAGVDRAVAMQTSEGAIPVGADVPNEHRNAFILEALLMAHEFAGIDTRTAVRGIMHYRMDFTKPPRQEVVNIDVQAVGYLLHIYPRLLRAWSTAARTASARVRSLGECQPRSFTPGASSTSLTPCSSSD